MTVIKDDRQTSTEQGFSPYQLSSEILESLHILGYDTPTKIQKQVIPAAMAGRDVVGSSQTGSGKTAAFGIPLCELADWNENKPQALVLEPTRELTVQVKEELYHIGRKKRLKVPDVFGGFPIDKQIQTLKQKSHIVVGTPGRIMDHVRRESLDLSQIRRVVIDEADLMLDMGFLEEVREILRHIPQNRVMMLFSATMGEEIQQLIETFLHDPVVISITESVDTRADIRQELYETTNEEKYVLFLRLLEWEDPESAMIFCGTREMVNVLCRKLRKDGVKCGMIHGEIDQQDRIRTVEGFRQGRFRYLIATDVVARGIDFDRLSHVFNYDFPTGRETYVHRIGRTGRNGEPGTAISLFTSSDFRMKHMIEELTGYELPVRIYGEHHRNDSFWKHQSEKPILKKKKGAGFQRTITRLSIGGGRKSKMRAVDIVGTICSIPGMTPEDIGAIDVRDSLTYVEILNGKGKSVLTALQEKTIKGKLRKVRETRNI